MKPKQGGKKANQKQIQNSISSNKSKSHMDDKSIQKIPMPFENQISKPQNTSIDFSSQPRPNQSTSQHFIAY